MLNLVTRLYAVFLRLYPRKFRNEFADEMHTVFLNALTEEAKRGRVAWMVVCWREIRDLPGSLWREHALDRKEARMDQETASSGSDEKRLSWREIVVGLFPFSLGIISLLLSYPSPSPTWKSSKEWQMLTFAAYLIPLFVILGIGWAAKFPRWSFPYLGAVTYVMTIVFTEPMRRLLMLGTAEAQVLTTGMMVFLIFGCLVLIGSVWRPLNSLYQGVRRDWTQFSFALYVGAVLLASAVDHDDYPTLTAMVMMPSLILLLGALAYLRSTTKLHRILSMLIPLSLAIAVRIIENKEFYPAIIAIMGGIAFLPALLEFLPREEKSPRTA